MKPYAKTRFRASTLGVLALSLTSLILVPLAHATGINVDSARIGCLDIQRTPNLTELVKRRCDGTESCDYQAPKPKEYHAAGVQAATRTFCSQAMEIKYDCGSGAQQTVTVPGDAWKRPPAKLYCQASGHAAMTRFDPMHDGFHFDNTYKNDLVPKGLNIPGLNIHTGGLCGGMVYAALDYFNAHKTIPIVPYRPATGTTLAQYFYQRETRSIEADLPEWTNIYLHSGHAAVFKRGLDGRAGQPLANLMSYIDRGVPVVLGLKGIGTFAAGHQVLAIGYDLGRYQGNYGPFESDLKIKLYDPDDHDEVSIMQPNPTTNVWVINHPKGGWKDEYRGYFVDTKYSPKTPPQTTYRVYPTDNKIHELLLVVKTGNDDLRGGQANLNLEVDQTTGAPQTYPNINKSARWLANYYDKKMPTDKDSWLWARVVLSRPLYRGDIRKLVLTYTARSGIGHDTFKMASLAVEGLINNKLVEIGNTGEKYFRIKDPRLEIPIPVVKYMP